MDDKKISDQFFLTIFSWIYTEAVEKNQDKSAIIELFKTVLDNEEQS